MSKFQVGDRVKVTASLDRLADIHITDNVIGDEATIVDIDEFSYCCLPNHCQFNPKFKKPFDWWLGDEDLELISVGYPIVKYEPVKTVIDAPAMRTFETGATRSSEAGKLDFEGFLSPIVLERYAQYLNKHRTQADGRLRDSDNWQKGIPKDQYLKSAIRHLIDVWKQHRGFEGQDSLQDSLCAVLFNIQGYLFEELKNESLHKSSN